MKLQTIILALLLSVSLICLISCMIAFGACGLKLKLPALHEAAARGDMVATRQLLKEGIDPNLRAPDGSTALWRALIRDHLSLRNF